LGLGYLLAFVTTDDILNVFGHQATNQIGISIYHMLVISLLIVSNLSKIISISHMLAINLLTVSNLAKLQFFMQNNNGDMVMEKRVTCYMKFMCSLDPQKLFKLVRQLLLEKVREQVTNP
jgi:hypothetical protein